MHLRVLGGKRFSFNHEGKTRYHVTHNLADRGQRWKAPGGGPPMATAALRRLTAQQVSHAIITAAMKVHTELGPGLLESTYTACLQYELIDMGFQSSSQVGLPVVYRGVKLELGYRIDLVVENLVIVEIKSVDAISPIH